MTEIRVQTILRTEAPLLSTQTPIRRAVAALVSSGAPAAPVLGDDGQMVGILTQKDCFRPSLHASYHREWTGQVGDFMSSPVIAVDIQDEIIRVAEMFMAHPHRVFPVLQDTTVAGLVHRSDVLRVLVHSG